MRRDSYGKRLMKRMKKTEKSYKTNYRQIFMLTAAALVMVLVTLTSLLYVRSTIEKMQGNQGEDHENFQAHYVFITGSMEGSARNGIYEGAKEYAEKEKIYLEWFGSGLAVDYLKEELLRMAIASNVDGIILEGDESEEIRSLVDEAVEKGIPVVTVMTDSYNSKRQSFVGVGSHYLGREYGRQIIKISNKETKDALILMSSSADDSAQNMIFTSMKETLANEGNHLNIELNTLVVNEDSPYSMEEAIRNLFLDKEELPEIIICLSEENTSSVYQAAMNYNAVGQVKILGYSVSDTILNAIDRNVISAVCVVDYEQMGIYCVKALDEYIETGYVNNYVTMDVDTITKNNVERYLENAGK